jgi:hypothetical protein
VHKRHFAVVAAPTLSACSCGRLKIRLAVFGGSYELTLRRMALRMAQLLYGPEIETSGGSIQLFTSEAERRTISAEWRHSIVPEV